jgi:hypothetical protein
VLAQLAGAVHELRPAMELMGPAAQEGRGIMRQLAATAPRLKATLGDVRALSRPAVKAVPDVYRMLCE